MTSRMPRVLNGTRPPHLLAASLPAVPRPGAVGVEVRDRDGVRSGALSYGSESQTIRGEHTV